MTDQGFPGVYVGPAFNTTGAPVLDFPEQRWRTEAVCNEVDPEIFYPEKGGSTRPAKRICAACPVTEACLEYALDNDERFGIWGGLSARERIRMARPA